MYKPILYLLGVLMTGSLAGCGDDASPAEPAGGNLDGAAGGGDTDSVQNGDDPMYPPAPCAVQPEDFALNQMTTSSESLFAVKIVAADPAPPAKFDNAWEVEIVTPDGTPMAGATIDEVLPWMPAHNHGAGYDTNVTETGTGSFGIKPLYLWMGGGWTVTFTVTVDGQTDEAVVDVCIPD